MLPTSTQNAIEKICQESLLSHSNQTLRFVCRPCIILFRSHPAPSHLPRKYHGPEFSLRHFLWMAHSARAETLPNMERNGGLQSCFVSSRKNWGKMSPASRPASRSASMQSRNRRAGASLSSLAFLANFFSQNDERQRALQDVQVAGSERTKCTVSSGKCRSACVSA